MAAEGTDVRVHTLIPMRQAEPLWTEGLIAKVQADAAELGQRVSGIRWTNGVTSVVRWRATWTKPAWDDLVTAYFWGTIGRQHGGQA